MGRESRERALALWEEGTEILLSGDVEGAIDLFTRSLDVEETAEGYTFRGWAYAQQGRLAEAIAECRLAIATDPTFGNPYNDIGCYLLQQGKADEAVGWFEKAKRAERYESRHFPYLNLGRLLFARGMVGESLAEFEEALRLHPGDPVAKSFLSRLRYCVN
ncbi:tetratricopeptide repeat protein [Acidobacteria bacterium ACD]|nr:MAG: tetratricopeptide repeat protein [Acidobacteriota bacterium]MCE7956977.1 tetratricopeptide repeat protein [Acidobacteria bacterium ACB2]MDL1948453.1 tetratricopeptide repeat protein [Acidobacteria bacterium ACD]